MVLISVQSVEDSNGYEFKNDFAESLIIDPKSRVSLVNIQFKRRADYVILESGNQFQIQIGGDTQSQDIIGITTGTYTAQSLSEEIQLQLNNHYSSKGHFFEVNYDYKEKRFTIRDSFQNRQLMSNRTVSYDNINPAFVESADIVPVSDAGEVDLTGITKGTANYLTSTVDLESNDVPIASDLGTNAVFSVESITSAVFPPVATGNNSNGDAIVDMGFMVGLQVGSPTGKFATGFGAGGSSKIVNTNDNLLASIIFYSDTTASEKIKIVEKGVDIGVNTTHKVEAGDEYRIMLTTDSQPVYQFKRTGQEFRSFDISDGNQSVLTGDWFGMDIHPIIASDVPGLKMINQVTPSGQQNLKPLAITAGDNDQRKNAHTLVDGDFKRSVVGNYAGLNTANQGYITQELAGNGASLLQFKLPTTMTADFYVSVLDETVRKANQTSEGNDATDMGIADPAWGNTAQQDGSAEAVPDINPALVSFRFKTWDGDSAYNDKNDRIYYRPNFNAYNTTSDTPDAIENEWNEIAGFDWVANPNALFQINVIGSGDYCDFIVSPKGNKIDNVVLATIKLPRVKKDGLFTVGTLATQTAFGASQTGILLKITKAGTTPALATGNTDGNGHLTVVSQALVSGSGFGVGDAVNIINITNTTGQPNGTGAGTAVVTALSTYDHTGNFTSSNGYSFWLGFGNPEIASDTESTVSSVSLLTSTNVAKEYNVKFFPRYEPIFGDTLGFKKNHYVLTNLGDEIESDENPIPNQQVSTEPTIMVNLDNLPIKSYIGKRFKADSLITDKPVGNLQGLTRMVAKVPRFHDDQGDGSSAGIGPYHYDYFPYSVPLHNATELVLNELDITLKNPDGTLATDITETHMLLQLTKVDSVGEGNSNRGGVGAPREAPMSYDRLDITKGQLEPSIRGGFAQGDGAMSHSQAPDQWGHAKLNANKSHAL